MGKMMIAVVALSLLAGCGKGKEECRQLEGFVADEAKWGDAPQQADMSPQAQAANWRWRAERARERAKATRALELATARLKPLVTELAKHYDGLAREADATAAAWEAGDNEKMNAHAGAFDGARNEPMDDFLARLRDACR